MSMSIKVTFKFLSQAVLVLCSSFLKTFGQGWEVGMAGVGWGGGMETTVLEQQ